jgi:lincosamide and streptogramin A transport system ATP-binding/permease protein
LIGRNGKGKTTLLKLINKNLEPVKGEIHSVTDTYYFPYSPVNNSELTSEVIRENIAPFRQWEREMESLLNKGDEESIKQYSRILEQYQNQDGFKIDALIEKEIKEIGIENSLLTREFKTLSGGEQTRALLVSLFLKKNAFLLIDEPTNHLDLEGRVKLGEYLNNKKGFIIVSHDRYFLDLCTDHILSINKSDVRLNKGNFSQWKHNSELETNFEKKKKEKLSREVKSLEIAAKKRRKWSDLKEKEKQGAHDKGFISHGSAKLMKRAVAIENRVTEKLDEKRNLLKNFEKKRVLKLQSKSEKENLTAYMEDVSLCYNDSVVFKNISFYLRKGSRIAITGNNGTGKTSLLRMLTGELQPDKGEVYVKSGLEVSYVRQNPLWQKGYLKDILYLNKIDQTGFRNILAVLGTRGDIFERPLETFSKGEIKKIELCRSFIRPYDLLIWDEPLNYIDIMSREQIEEVVLKNEPTMIFAEHDAAFISNVATEVITLNK